MPVTCSAIAKSGSRCRRPALAGKQHCLMHDPESAELRLEASRKGGHARSNAARAAKVMPAALTSEELLVTLSRAMDKVEKGELEPGPANAISSLARAMNSIRETTEIERRLSELEQRAGAIDTRWRA
jgi:hypothetical protein